MAKLVFPLYFERGDEGAVLSRRKLHASSFQIMAKELASAGVPLNVAVVECDDGKEAAALDRVPGGMALAPEVAWWQVFPVPLLPEMTRDSVSGGGRGGGA